MPKNKRQPAPKAPVENKGKRGRPSKFDGLDLEKVRFLTLKGSTDKEMAEFFGIAEQTWNNWKIANASFLESLKDWKIEADGKVEASLYARATGYSHPEEKIFCNAAGEVTRVETVKHYPPDPTSMIFWLKNRQPEKWRDRQDIDVTSGGNPFTLVSAIPEPAKPPKEE